MNEQVSRLLESLHPALVEGWSFENGEIMVSRDEFALKLLSGILSVYPECKVGFVRRWIKEQKQQGENIEKLYNKFSAGYLRFSMKDGTLLVETSPLVYLDALGIKGLYRLTPSDRQQLLGELPGKQND